MGERTTMADKEEKWVTLRHCVRKTEAFMKMLESDEPPEVVVNQIPHGFFGPEPGCNCEVCMPDCDCEVCTPEEDLGVAQ